MNYILASKSPRRKELFQLICPEFRQIVSHVDERSIQITEPDKLCAELARLKCLAVFSENPDSCVIGSDTMVSVDGTLLGKPKDREDCIRMLKMLSGREHNVYTGVYIASPEKQEGFTVCTDVYFMEMSDAEIEAYADTDDPYDKAGAYGIQSGAARFIEKIDGDYFSVMGLPVNALYVHMKNLGLL